MNLYYNFDARHLCDAIGDPVSDLPEIAFNEQPVWNITPLRADGQGMDLSAVVVWRAAIDSDFTSETDVMCRTLPEAITVSGSTVSVPLDSNTSRFLQVVDRFETKPAYFELCGLDAAGKRIFYLIFRITARMVLDPGSTDSLPDAADLFADRAYVMALLRSGCEIQFSADGENWTSSAAAAVQWRYRNRSAGGEWSDPVPIIPGQSLIPDAVGTFNERPASAPENYKYLASDRGLLYFYLNGAWSEGTAIGPRGNTGRGIDSVAKISSDGLIDTYRITFSDGTTSDYTLANGSPGQDIDWDAVGAVEERTLYDDRPAGFRFAATVTDAAAKTNTVYIWKKASAASGHWLDPLVLVRYSIPGMNAALIEPMEFYPPGGSQTVLTVPASQYPAATIAAVCIDTADGELRLPYGSATGITRIIRKSSGDFEITFGAHVPEYDTGRIYFAQGVAYVYDVTDAPADGKIYGRQYGAWVEVTAGSSSDPSDPSDPGEDEDPFDNIVDPGNYTDELLIVGG